MKTINSTQNKFIRNIYKLKSTKYIQEEKLFLLEGKNLINEALKLNIVEKLLIIDKNMFSNVALERKFLVSKEIISKLSSNISNSGVIAICKYEKIDVDINSLNKIVVLENINNPGNFGTIIRTALAFKYDAIITIGNSVFTHNQKVIKASQGALFKIPIIQLKNYELLKNFKSYKFIVNRKAKSLDELEINDKKYALVFGNEANGLSEKILKEVKGEDVFINISKDIESLNLAVAAAIVLYKLK